MDIQDEIKDLLSRCDVVLVCPKRPPYHLAYLLAKTIFPGIPGNPVCPVFGYDGKVYGMEQDENLTEILVSHPDSVVCVLRRNVRWSSKRVRDFVDVMMRHDAGKVFIRYIAVGILGILLNLFSFFIFYKILKINDIISILMAIELSVITTFLLNNYWVYFNRVYTRSIWWRIGAYHLTMASGMIINIAIYKILKIWGFNYLLGDFMGILVSSLWVFYMTNAHVFFARYVRE